MQRPAEVALVVAQIVEEALVAIILVRVPDPLAAGSGSGNLTTITSVLAVALIFCTPDKKTC